MTVSEHKHSLHFTVMTTSLEQTRGSATIIFMAWRSSLQSSGVA